MEAFFQRNICAIQLDDFFRERRFRVPDVSLLSVILFISFFPVSFSRVVSIDLCGDMAVAVTP